jgi:ketosteroid isomerase-like protein
MTTEYQIQQLLDKDAVRTAINQYWIAFSRLDYDAVVNTFTPDAKFGSHHGHDEIRKRVEHSHGRLSSLNVVPGVQEIIVKGDTATADTQAIAFGIVPSPDGDRLIAQSLRFIDTLKKTPEGWRFTQRRGINDDTIIHDTDFLLELLHKPAK